MMKRTYLTIARTTTNTTVMGQKESYQTSSKLLGKHGMKLLTKKQFYLHLQYDDFIGTKKLRRAFSEDMNGDFLS